MVMASMHAAASAWLAGCLLVCPHGDAPLPPCSSSPPRSLSAHTFSPNAFAPNAVHAPPRPAQPNAPRWTAENVR
eukprot:COSAG01_NODE_744_length_13876_cov_4.660449_8_plen_75_part_00